MSQEQPATAPLRTYNVKEMARVCKVNPSSIYRMVEQDEFPDRLVARVGQRILFIADEADAWLRGGGTKATAKSAAAG